MVCDEWCVPFDFAAVNTCAAVNFGWRMEHPFLEAADASPHSPAADQCDEEKAWTKKGHGSGGLGPTAFHCTRLISCRSASPPWVPLHKGVDKGQTIEDSFPDRNRFWAELR